MSQEGTTRAQASVLVAGAINTDLVGTTERAPEAGETVTGISFGIYGGGKGANQAFASARFGAATAMLGAVGDDDFGRARRRDLVAEGIDIASVGQSADTASGVALITVETSGQNRILYVPGATLTVKEEQAQRALERFQPTVLMTTLELPLPTLRRLIQQSRAQGVTVVLNATPEPHLGAEFMALVDVLTVNEGEAVALAKACGALPAETRVGAIRDWGEIGQALRAEGAPAVVLTLGAAGAVIVDAEGARAISAPKVDVVDTTGAGDTLCGVVAAMVAEGASLDAAVEMGVMAGSLACTKAGAQPSIPTREEIEQFRRTTVVNRAENGEGET